MRSFLTALAISAAFAGTGASAWAQKGQRGEQEALKNGWLSSLSEGKAQAKKTGKPLFVVVRCVP